MIRGLRAQRHSPSQRSVVSTDASAAQPTHGQWRETLRRFHRCFSRSANAWKRRSVSTNDAAAQPTHGQWRETLRRFHRCFSRSANAWKRRSVSLQQYIKHHRSVSLKGYLVLQRRSKSNRGRQQCAAMRTATNTLTHYKFARIATSR
jgi:hypothetical protein